MGRTLSILLTGATGFVGSRVLADLASRGHKVWTLGRGAHPPVPGGGSRHVVADLSTPECLGVLGQLPRVDAVVHMAATPKLAGASARELENLHVAASAMLAGWAAANRTRFLHVSTAFVGPDASGHLAESHAFAGNALGEYERSKSRGEAAVLRAHPRGSEILRPGIVMTSAGDPVADHLRSPLGMFLRAAPVPPSPLALHPTAESPLPLVRRQDVVEFIAGRLASDPDPGPRFWNMIAPCGSSVAEVIRAAGYRAEGNSSRRLEPWRRYLEGSRTWDISGYFCEAARLGSPVLPISVDEILGVAGRVWGRGAAAARRVEAATHDRSA